MLPPIRTLPATQPIDTPIETPLGGRELDAVRVLHVDDEPGFLDLATTMLVRRDEQFDVVGEPSAEAGLERLSADRIDCVVSDYQMPGTGASSSSIESATATRTSRSFSSPARARRRSRARPSPEG